MQTIRSILEVAIQYYPDRIALQMMDTRFTYRQLVDKVTNIAYYLQSMGITSKDTVALFFQNTPPCIFSFLALAYLNIGVIPLEPEAPSSYSLDLIYQDIPFTAIIGCSPEINRSAHSFTQKDCSYIDIMNIPTDSQTLSNYMNYDHMSPNRIFLYHYTSGSTGEPKAALHSQTNLIKGGIIYKQTYQLHPEDNILVAIPLVHSFGMVAGLMASLLTGSKLVLIKRFIPRQILEILAKEKIAVLIAVPLIYDLLTRCYISEKPDLSALRVCLSSGAPLLPNIAEKFIDLYNKPIYQVYGTTETGVIAAQWPREERWPEESVGSPLTDVILRIVDENGGDLPINEFGILLVKTSTMFMGYHKHADVNAKVLQNGWYTTGDIACRDDANHIYLTGRKETFINISGKKVNPYEVEKVLLAHPMVKEAIVYGKNVKNAGEQVWADVVLRGKTPIDELLQFCRERLAFYKVPCRIRFVEAISKTTLGKIHRSVYSDTASK